MAAIRTASWGCVTKSLHVRYERCAPEMQMFPCRLAPASTHAHTHTRTHTRTHALAQLPQARADRQRRRVQACWRHPPAGWKVRTHTPTRTLTRSVPGQHVACYLPQDDCDACALPAQRYARLRRPPSQHHWRVERRHIWLSRRRCALRPTSAHMAESTSMRFASYGGPYDRACACTHRAVTHVRLCRRRRQCSCGSSRAT